GTQRFVAGPDRRRDDRERTADVAENGQGSQDSCDQSRKGDRRREALAETFAGWGYPTAEATRALRGAFPHATLIASGGVRSGVDVAKAIALGADLAGIGLPFLEPATRSARAVGEVLDLILAGLRIAIFASGGRRPADLRDALYERGSDAIAMVEPST
ncbi:MAG: alpha-hydroxy-acid oxidizing protein, partial [Candidatus Baltobacteraceae bacterium]